MLSLSMLSAAVVLILSGLRPAFALPTDNAALLPRTVPADTIDKYTVAFFQGTAQKKPPPRTCLFYTEGLSQKAQAYAIENEMFTIWGVWPCSFYDRDQNDANPLRDILKPGANDKNTAATQTYFEHMSEAYASLCSEYAWVMSDTLPDVNEKGIWGKIEKPTLQRVDNIGGKVDQIDACDEDLSNCLKNPPYWKRPGTKKLVREVLGNSNTTEPGKRQTSNCPLCASLPNQCFTPEEIGKIFADVDKLW